MNTNIERNLCEEQFSKTGYSNSQFKGQSLTFCPPENYKVSFDNLTLVADLKKNADKKLVALIDSGDNEISPLKVLTDCAVLKIFDSVYFSYDKLKAKSFNSKNVRLEFNPNSLSDEKLEWLHKNIVSLLRDISFSRIDVAFDVNVDLRDYHIFQQRSTKSRKHFSQSGELETLYLGSTKSERQVRMYNKKVERKTKADIDVNIENWWRLEIELRHSMCLDWRSCLEGLDMRKVNYKNAEKATDKIMLCGLMNDSSLWTELTKNTRKKYKDMMNELAEESITDDLNVVLKDNEYRLNMDLEKWSTEDNIVFSK